MFLPNAGKAFLHHVLGLLAVAEAGEREAEKPVGILLHALVVLTSVHRYNGNTDLCRKSYIFAEKKQFNSSTIINSTIIATFAKNYNP
jgi:hypothetical protein